MLRLLVKACGIVSALNRGLTMPSRSSIRSFALIVVAVSTVFAQIGDHPEIPLKNWPTPLYWQPTPAEADAASEKPATIRNAGTPEAQAPPESFVFVGM